MPLFFAGLALLVVPWLIHRIRRPERETVRFSSLMFVPDIKREVIERRRVQHILLMALRIFLFLLLALAFTRPFQEVLLGVDTPAQSGTHHVILLDASLSMSANGVWEKAKQEAIALLDEVKTGDRVGVIRFAQQAYVDVPLSEDVAWVSQALDGATWTWEKGDALLGLQAAADMLAGEADVQRVVHLVSDFQATGLPTVETGWALPGHMRLHPVVIGEGDWVNVSVDALALRSVGQQTLQVRARIKNWQGTDALTARLWLDGEAVEAKTFSIAQGHASQVRFDVPERTVSGFVEVVGNDVLGGDNRRFFTFQPAPKKQVLVLQSGTLSQLMQAVVPDNADLPWQVSVASDFSLTLSEKPAVVVAGRVLSHWVGDLKNYVEAGGHLFLPLQREADVQVLRQLLKGSDLEIGVAETKQTRVPLAWVDLKHRIFYPFRGAKFNDFSSVRYSGYHLVKGGRPLARFEGEDVMMAEASLGQGRVLVWAGGLEMNRSNLARSPRFVPLVHETLRYLAGEQVAPPAVFVGDVVEKNAVTEPGVLVWENGQSVAVNVQVAESDPAQVTPAEFEIRMCEAPVLYRAGEVDVASATGGELAMEEYGYWILIVMFAFLLVEHGYAAWLESHPKQEQA